MSFSKYRLPLLDLFHTFESVACHRSFTLAAGELCLTQSAVSGQIKALEDALGLRLFRRLHRAIDVTAEGQRLHESVTRGLDDISAYLAALGAAAKAPQLTVCASVAFAWFWLMPRLERFGALQPDVDLRVLATDQPVCPARARWMWRSRSAWASGRGWRHGSCSANGSIRCAAQPICATILRCTGPRTCSTRRCCIWNMTSPRSGVSIGGPGSCGRVSTASQCGADGEFL